MGFLQEIGDELEAFAAWLWAKVSPPQRKTWCAAFYFVAQEDQSLDYPEQTLDEKMSEAVAAVKLAAGAVDANVHVVYRTVPSDLTSDDPVAKVVRFLGPSTGTKFFPDCYVPVPGIEFLDTGKDLTCFLKWVYKWCPADHYAIFIWGHSFGPGGLFEPGSGLTIPKPGLAALQEAFEQFQATRLIGDRDKAPAATTLSELSNPTSSPGGAGSGASPQDILDDSEKKVEIVLFEDCWMSTLETAFEIADSTSRMVASQSLLPLGRDYANFKWPYEDLLKALATSTFAEDMTDLLVKFYKDNFAQVQYLTTIPVTLLDLTAVPALRTSMPTLVAQLHSLTGAERRPLLEPARLVDLDSSVFGYDPILLAGDGALLDMLKLCADLKAQTWPAQGTSAQQAAAHAAVTSVETALKDLVKVNKEAHAVTSTDRGFQGVSAFHWPPIGVDTDDFIKDAVRRSVSAYLSLRFETQTNWSQLGLEHKPY